MLVIGEYAIWNNKFCKKVSLLHYSYKLNLNKYWLKIMTLSSYSYKKDLHFVVVVGDLKGDSKEVVLEILKTIIKKSKNIKNISDFNIFGKSLKRKKILSTK